MNHEDYVPYEIAVKMKERGFDWPCNHYWKEHTLFGPQFCKTVDSTYFGIDAFGDTEFPSSTLSQAQKWLREKGVVVYGITYKNKTYKAYINYTKVNCDGVDDVTETLDAYTSYEEALSEGINKALKEDEKTT